MKKFIFTLLLIFSFFNLGCTTKMNSVINNISELQLTYFNYEDSKVSISLISGIREKDYVLNGYSTSSVDYCVLMLEQNTFTEINNINIRINGKDNYITPLLNPYNNNYVYDLEIPLDEKSLVSISYDDNFYTLTNIAVDFEYDYKDCLNSIIHDSNLSHLFNKNNFNGEVFIRLIKLKDFNNIFFQFLFVGTDFQSIQYIINPFTLEKVNI